MEYNLVFRKIKMLFNYKSDKEIFGVPEKWNSYLDNVLNNEPFFGDCDDFAMTCAAYLIHLGVDTSLIFLAFCKLKNSNTFHLVCVCDNWVFDNRQSSIVEFGWLDNEYEWISGMSIQHPGKWKKIC